MLYLKVIHKRLILWVYVFHCVLSVVEKKKGKYYV